MTPKDALQEAINAAGGQNSLARTLKVRQGRIWYWLRKAKHGVSAPYATKIEEVVGGKVKRHQLRPDLYDAPASEVAA